MGRSPVTEIDRMLAETYPDADIELDFTTPLELLVAIVLLVGLWPAAMIGGVLIFAGLTAYDTQSIKATYVAHAALGDAEWLGRAAIMGALQLYLDFINMFMFLLQLFGNRE